MKCRLSGATTTWGASIVTLLLLSGSAAGQSATAAGGAWTGPRTADGQPDVQGTWDAVISGSFSLVTPMAGGGRFNALATGRELPKNPSRIVDPADGRVPYQPWAAALQQAQEKDVDYPTRPWHIDPQNRCLPQGVSRGFYTTQARILQLPGQVVFLFQQYQYYRIIRLGAPHIGHKCMKGHSVVAQPALERPRRDVHGLRNIDKPERPARGKQRAHPPDDVLAGQADPREFAVHLLLRHPGRELVRGVERKVEKLGGEPNLVDARSESDRRKAVAVAGEVRRLRPLEPQLDRVHWSASQRGSHARQPDEEQVEQALAHGAERNRLLYVDASMIAVLDQPHPHHR